jgi:uncharacterized alkaline shock family protein YloU
MTSKYRSAGKTTLTPDVLLTIARMAALEVEGVRRMASVRGNLLERGFEGVRVTVEDANVFVDLFLVLEQDINFRDVSREVQHSVTRAITETTGLQVGHVNIHIEDIEYEPEA